MNKRFNRCVYISVLAVFLVVAFSQTAFCNQHLESKKYADYDDLSYTLFIDEPLPDLADVSKLSIFSMKNKIEVEKLKEAMVGSFFPLIGSLQGSFIAGDIDVKNILLNAVSVFKKSMISAVGEINHELSDKPEHIFMGYLPWAYKKVLYPGTSNTISFSGFKVGGDFLGKPLDFNEKIANNIKTIIEHSYDKKSSPFYFISAVVNITLQKNNSKVTIETVLGLTPRELPMDNIGNEQVDFSHLVIPKVKVADKAPVIMMTLTQKLDEDSAAQADVKFGPFGGWNKDHSGFVMLDDKRGSIFKCGHRHSSAIYLKGTLKKKAAPSLLGFFVKGKPVDLRIYDLTMELEKALVSSMNLYASAGFKFGKARKTFGCFNNEGVDGQFQNEVNKKIEQQLTTIKEKAAGSGLVDLILSKIR